MNAIGTTIMLIGTIVTIVGVIKFILRAFDEGMLWGLGVILFPITSLVFLIIHWPDAWRPTATTVCGYGIVIVGAVLKTATVV